MIDDFTKHLKHSDFSLQTNQDTYQQLLKDQDELEELEEAVSRLEGAAESMEQRIREKQINAENEVAKAIEVYNTTQREIQENEERMEREKFLAIENLSGLSSIIMEQMQIIAKEGKA